MAHSLPREKELAPSTPESDLKVTLPDPESGYSTPRKAESLLLADRPTAYIQRRGPITDSIINFFKIRRNKGEKTDLDDIATQPSVFDGPHAEFYQPRADWEVSTG
mgnify:CR=1 FL=1|jgi:hypothetical protein